MCDFADVELPVGVEGQSLRPLLDGGEEATWRDHLVAQTDLPWGPGCAGRMVRTERFKYVAYSWCAHREQLFDLEADPGEMVNLAVSARYDGVRQAHRDLLRAWCERTHDGFGSGHYAHRGVPFLMPGDEYPQTKV